MSIRQISVFLENVPGSLAKPVALLAQEGIDLIAMSIADTAEYGILRFIVAECDKCVALLKKEGYIVRQTCVLGVSVEDKPGGLSKVLGILSENGISVEYLYSFVRRASGSAMLIVNVNDNEKACAVLRENGVAMLDENDLENM